MRQNGHGTEYTGRYDQTRADYARVPTKPVLVRMAVIRGGPVTAWWWNPRDGKAARIGTLPNEGERSFVPPDAGEALDWVLVLDAAAQGFPPPGQGSGEARR